MRNYYLPQLNSILEKNNSYIFLFRFSFRKGYAYWVKIESFGGHSLSLASEQECASKITRARSLPGAIYRNSVE